MFTAKCNKCGKEFEQEDKWQFVYKKFPEKVLCDECKSGKSSQQTTTSKAKDFTKEDSSTNKGQVVKAATFKKSANTSNYGRPEPKIEARHIKKYFDIIRAEFADEWEDVKEYAGGWTTTLLLNAKMRGELDE